MSFRGDRVQGKSFLPDGYTHMFLRDFAGPGPSRRLKTAAIGPFNKAVNFASMSPDGARLAVCMDK